MTETEQRNMTLVLDAFDTLFNKRDYAARNASGHPTISSTAPTFPPGREGLFALVKASPADMRYENGLITAAVIT